MSAYADSDKKWREILPFFIFFFFTLAERCGRIVAECKDSSQENMRISVDFSSFYADRPDDRSGERNAEKYVC